MAARFRDRRRGNNTAGRIADQVLLERVGGIVGRLPEVGSVCIRRIVPGKTNECVVVVRDRRITGTHREACAIVKKIVTIGAADPSYSCKFVICPACAKLVIILLTDQQSPDFWVAACHSG
jgi:hypothetical protein